MLKKAAVLGTGVRPLSLSLSLFLWLAANLIPHKTE